MNLNKVIIAGRLTADPELRTTTTGNNVASFSVATNRYWRDKDGQKQEATEYHNIVVWGRQAEIVNQFCSKGSIIIVEGRLQTRSWEGKDGQTRKTTEVVAENIQFGPRGSEGGGNYSQKNNTTSNKQNNKVNDSKDELETIDIDTGETDSAPGDEINPEDLPF